MRASVAVSVDKGRGATPSSRKEEFHAANTEERHGLRRRLRADQRGAQRGDHVSPGGRWLARSHRQRGHRWRRRRYAAPHLTGFRRSNSRRPVPVGDERRQRRPKRFLGCRRRLDRAARARAHGAAPKSVDERDGLVVVLNTGEPGLTSFRLNAEGIAPVEGGHQALDTSDADPAQVAFSPNGSMVVITQRGTDSVVTYEVAPEGTFGASSEVASEGPTPYGFAFTSDGTLVVTEAYRAEKGAAAASSYTIVDGALVARTSSVGNGRSEICWAVVTPDDRFAFTTNFADGAVSRYAIASDGSLSLEDATAGISVDGMPGLRDEDLSSEGRFLYALDADGGRIYGWAVGAEGSLEPIGSWEGLPATVAGLAAN